MLCYQLRIAYFLWSNGCGTFYFRYSLKTNVLFVLHQSILSFVFLSLSASKQIHVYSTFMSFVEQKKKKKITVIMTYFFCVKANGVFALQKCVTFGCGLMSAWLCADSIVYHLRQHILSEMSVWNLSISPNMKINQYVFLFYLQEVGSIIGKKGEIVNRFREEVRKISI